MGHVFKGSDDAVGFRFRFGALEFRFRVGNESGFRVSGFGGLVSTLFGQPESGLHVRVGNGAVHGCSRGFM